MSRRARGYYWKVVVPAIARWQGEAKYRDTHRWLKREFLPAGDDPDDVEGQGYSTKVALMPDADYSDYVQRVVAWATAEGIGIPERGDQNHE